MARDRAKRRSRSSGWRVGLNAAMLVCLLAAFISLGLAFFARDLTRDLPSVELLPRLLDPEQGELLQPSRLYSRDGEQVLLTLENPGAGPRRFLAASLPETGSSPASEKPGHFSPFLVLATLEAADPDFTTHYGFSLYGLREGSHPTLAQRLVSDLLLWNEPPSLRRALRERLLAYQVTARFGREQVLTWYLNSADYGNMTYGAEAAARVYFGKSAASLTLAEAALLAAVGEAPALNPHDAPQAGRERQQELIEAMLARGKLSEEVALQALTEEIKIQPPSRRVDNLASTFTGLVLSELERLGMRERLERGGVRVITTLDGRLQNQITCTALHQLERLSGAQGATTGSEPGPCEAAGLLPNLPENATGQTTEPAAEVVLLDPASGQVLAMFDSNARPGETSSPYPPLARHASGTLWTPVVYLTAFTRGLGPASLVWDLPPETEEETPAGMSLQEMDYQGPVRLRMALSNDLLSPAVQVLEQIGVESVLKNAMELGIPVEAEFEEAGLRAMVEGGPALTLLQAVRAFGVFANGGVMAGAGVTGAGGPVILLRIEDYSQAPWPEGSETVTGAAVERPVLSPQLAYLVTHILSDASARQSGWVARDLLDTGRQTAVKTGRTTGAQEAWTVGYTPQLVLGVWLSAPESDDNPAVSGSSLSASSSAGLWRALMQHAIRDYPAQGWTPPEGITRVDICDPSGLLPGPDCPNIVTEVFLAGSEPTAYDNLFQAIQINRETGRRATIFTPLDLIEERVFLITPPEARSWAAQAGLPVPPQEYDVLPAAAPGSPTARISSPSLFAVVRGEVPVLGSATGEDFDYYRLQLGKGLNPTRWQRLGSDRHSPVAEGRLGVWDTEGLDGLYVLELLVVHADQTVSTSAVQVTVDNHPPQVVILNPGAGQTVSAAGQRSLLIQAQVTDNLGISQVDFYVDGNLLSTLVQPPYSTAWRLTPGEHTLEVVATDQAGNETVSTIDFSVN